MAFDLRTIICALSLNRENEPLIFPPHFASRRLKLHEITQRTCKDEGTWPLNATYFRAAALQLMTPWPSIVRIVVREAASRYMNEIRCFMYTKLPNKYTIMF